MNVGADNNETGAPAMTDRQLECHMAIYLATVAAMSMGLLVYVLLM